jgi:hypothetical protein
MIMQFSEEEASRKEFLSYVDELVKSSLSSKRHGSTDSATSTTKSGTSPPPNAEITRRESDVYDGDDQDGDEDHQRGSYITKNGIIEYTADKNCAQIVSEIVRTGHKGESSVLYCQQAANMGLISRCSHV